MDALLLVDIQNDFLPGGPLGVPDGDSVVPVANALMPHFDFVVATKDWHPADHGSFAANHDGRTVGEVIELEGLPQIMWPTHCVQETPGAEFAPTLDTARIDHIVLKGLDHKVDSYSGFFDNGRRQATGLADVLRARQVARVYVMGLATDYCVKFTALDARSLGFETILVSDGCRGVDLQPGDVDRVIAEMQAAGVIVMKSADVAATLRENSEN